MLHSWDSASVSSTTMPGFWRVAGSYTLTLVCATAMCVSNVWAQDAGQPVVGSVLSPAEALADCARRGSSFLLSSGQLEDGSFGKTSEPAITALCVTALLRHGRSPDDPAMAKSLEYLLGFSHPDGGIYAEGSFYQNYETCIAIMALSAANKDGRYTRRIEEAQKFARQLQWDEGEGKKSADVEYGGGGYGRNKRPDLSNTQFLIEALKAQETEENRAAISRALIFVSRCQNLKGPHNDTPFPEKNPDGGFYYTPASGGSSQAGTTDSGGLRSYGSMTYAGLKSMIFAGVKADDPRVQAAMRWLEKNYTLQENPGMGTSGLFYYYHTMAKALNAVGSSQFKDAEGLEHPWKLQMIRILAEKQQANGSWVNPNDRWLEGDANLVTAYALLTLDQCRVHQPQ
jgi:squalene-hopene/tetraprenyl-beta-curcumene cyclase